MNSTLDTNVIIHLYDAGLGEVLHSSFDKIYVYEYIIESELMNHGSTETINAVRQDIADGKIIVIKKKDLIELGVCNVFEDHVRENRVIFEPGDLGEIYAIALAKTLGYDLSFSVKRGRVFGLLGANGAGKSTSIECILGTKKADHGLISVLGMSPISDRKKLFQRVGVQFQEVNYQENIKVGELCEITASLYSKPVDYKSLLKEFGVADKLNAFVKELSGGQRQRLFIVLALIRIRKLSF